MSIRETFEWVALPAGRSPGADSSCRVSVFIAPQVMLVDEGERVLRLDELADLVDWPDEVATISFDVEFEGTPAVAAQRVGRAPDSALWRRLFPGDTRVIPFVPDDVTTHSVVGFSTGEMVEMIETGYADAAPLDLPPIDPFEPDYWQGERWMPAPEPEPGGPEPGGPEPGPDGLTPEPDGPEPGPGPDELVPGPDELIPGPDDLLVPVGPIDPFKPDPAEPWLVGNLFPALMNVVTQPGNAWTEGMGEDAANVMRHAVFLAGAPNDIPMGDAEPLRNTADLEAARFAESMRLRWLPLAPLERDGEADGEAAADPDPVQQLIDSYDLHRILASLGDHAPLLRALGLIVDLEVPVAPPAAGRMRVLPRRGANAGPLPTDRTPWIAVTTAGPARFAAASDADAEVPPGLESLARYSVVQLDVEAAGGQLLDAVAGELTGVATPIGLPALRTVGLRLVRAGAASDFITRGERINELRAMDAANDDQPGSADATLDADAVQRGVRMDVLDEATGHWHSLHARTSTFSTDAGPVLGPVVSEGSIAGSFTGAPLAPGESPPPGHPVEVQEALLTWNGWSLSTPRPGGAISADPLMTDEIIREERGGELVTRPENAPLTSTGLRIDTDPLEGSLPRLRFGRDYRVRLRSVDLAGNALTVPEADAAVSGGAGGTAVSTPVTFRRYEPVPPPVPAFRVDPDASGFARHGDTERRIVVRSGLDDGDEAFGPEPGVSERLLFPPNCSVTLAEWHGAFDAGLGPDASDADREAAYARATRESGTLRPGAAETPWLSDPASAGVCLLGLPGASSDAIVTLAWPSTPAGPGPIRLRVRALDVDVPRPPEVDEEAGIIDAFLPPGARASVEVSSMLADASIMAVPTNWLNRLPAGSAALADANAKLDRHRHPMVTPPLPLEMVHATQRPFMTPAPPEPAVLVPRTIDDTRARVQVQWSIHAPTTATVELNADWTIPLDEPVPAGDPRALGPDGDGAGGGVGVHTGARFAAAAVAMRAQPGAQTLVTLPPPGELTMRTVTVVDRPMPGESGEADTTGQPGHGPVATIDLDTSGHVRLRLTAVATSRFGEYFPPEYGPAEASEGVPARESRLTRESDVIVIDVPSTRRPPAPTVVDVLPLVVRQVNPDGVRREGGWLRVWFARPWFMSGWDESPALLAGRDAQPRHTGADDWRVSTLVGPDPARQVIVYGGYTSRAEGDFFDDAVDVKLLEMAASDAQGGPATVLVDRRIDWDPVHEAWFTDLRIDAPDLYFPFVRLALAAHQPHSIEGDTVDHLRVSPIVTPDPMQVLPDRHLRHRVEANGVQIDLVGQTYGFALGPVDLGSAEFPNWLMQTISNSSTAKVVVQRRVRTGGDELLAWEDEFEVAMENRQGLPPGVLHASVLLPFDPTDPAGTYRAVVIEEDVAYGPQISSTPQEIRPRATLVEVVPLPRAVAG